MDRASGGAPMEPTGHERPMDASLDAVRMAILEEYEREGRVDLPAWTARHPELRDAILERAFWLDQVAHAEDADAPAGGRWEDTGGVLGTLLGEGLRERLLGDMLASQQRELASVLTPSEARKREWEAARAWASEALERGGEATPTFRRAALHAWVFDELRAGTVATGRLRVHLVAYLLEHVLGFHFGIRLGETNTTGWEDLERRYGPAERLAAEAGWYERRGGYYRAGPQLEKAGRYAAYFLADPAALQLSEFFVDQLSETSIKDMAIGVVTLMVSAEVERGGERPSEAAVRQLFGSAEEEKEELAGEEAFGRREVEAALEYLRRLGLVAG